MSIKIKRARKTVDLCTDLALVAAHDRALRVLESAQQQDGQLVNPSETTVAAAARVAELEQEMRAATVHFELEAMRDDEWQAFEAAHPARDGNSLDETLGVDASAISDLVPGSTRGVTDHEGNPIDFDPATEWADLARELSNGQWQDFAASLVSVNRGVTGAPFSLAASRVIRLSANA